MDRYISSAIDSIDQPALGAAIPFTTSYVKAPSVGPGPKADTPRYLITLDRGMGDAVSLGLSAIDQVIQNDPNASGTIDVLCNPIQAQIFLHDPRINRIIATRKMFFPGPKVSEWLQGVFLDEEQARLIDFLRERHYEAVFPSVVAPGLFFRLHSPLMYPDFHELVEDYKLLKEHEEVSNRKVVRQMVNNFFNKKVPLAELDDEPVIYISPAELQKAQAVIATIKERAGFPITKTLLVAADTSTATTRPPTDLLASALAEVLERSPHLIVCIMPGYTTKATGNLADALAPHFDDRIFQLAAEPRPTLLETAALIDRFDLFLTPDTGVMHLAAARKIVVDAPNNDSNPDLTPKNSVKIIALFGGTNPDHFGYRRRTMILGKYRKEQERLWPGITKENYDPKGRNLFDHITPTQIAEALFKFM